MIEDYNLKVNINNSRPKYGEAGLDFNHLTGPTLVTCNLVLRHQFILFKIKLDHDWAGVYLIF